MSSFQKENKKKYQHVWNKEKCAEICVRIFWLGRLRSLSSLSSPTPKIVYTFVVFSKLIADFVAKRNEWNTILQSKHKHFERTKTNEIVVFLSHLDRMCFCFSEIMSIAFKWQDHFKSVSLKTFDLRTHHTSKQAIHVLCIICMITLEYWTTNFTYALKYRMCIAEIV